MTFWTHCSSASRQFDAITQKKQKKLRRKSFFTKNNINNILRPINFNKKEAFYALRYFFIDKPDATCYISCESNTKLNAVKT